MTELFGLLSSITGLIFTGTTVSTKLSVFIDHFRTAPRGSQNLARELQELCSVLDRLWRSFSSREPRENDPLFDLQDVLNSCRGELVELEGLMKAHLIRDGGGVVSRQMKKWKWNFQEKEISALRGRLEAHKATLSIALLLSAHVEATFVRESRTEIEQRIREAKDKLTIEGGGGKTSSKATSESNYVLRKYLDGCNTSGVFSLRASTSSPRYERRVTSPLPRVREDEIKRLHRNSTPIPVSHSGLGEDVGRCSSAASMRPLRYRPSRTLQRRHSDMQISAPPENVRSDPDPQLLLRQRYRGGRAAVQRETQKRKFAAAKELETTTDQIWEDVRSLVDQNLPYEVLSEQLQQAQLRLESARDKINRQYNQEIPQKNPEHRSSTPTPSLTPSRQETQERKTTTKLQKGQIMVKETELKSKPKPEKQPKPKASKIQKKPPPSPAPASAAAAAKGKEKFTPQKKAVASEEQSAVQRAKEAAKLRELILPKTQANFDARGVISGRGFVIGRIVEESNQPPPRTEERLGSARAAMGVPFTTRVYKVHVCKEALDEEGVEYTEEDESFLIHRNCSMLDQMSLRIRTNQIRGD